MIKKWSILTVLWTAICLAAPTAVLAGGQSAPGGIVLQEETGDIGGEET